VPDVVLLTVAGLHVPIIPLVEVVSKTGAVVPLQNAGIAVKVGATIAFTAMDSVVEMPHCPAFGVNV
jgi:hypothetical protein